MMKVFFCHGVPGSEADAVLIRRANPDIEITGIDLLSYDPLHIGLALLDKTGLERRTGEEGIVIVGFSIGAMAAIRIAVANPDTVSRLVLVSPAAPLDIGDFLSAMDGKPVFELAKTRPGILAILTVLQGLMTRRFPGIMLGLLFGKCAPAEKALLQDSEFRAALISGLRNSFVDRRQNYLAYVKAYVSDWSSSLAEVRCPVDLWHGSEDTWSPPDMSTALADRFGDKSTLRMIEGTGHYSTMARVTI